MAGVLFRIEVADHLHPWNLSSFMGYCYRGRVEGARNGLPSYDVQPPNVPMFTALNGQAIGRKELRPHDSRADDNRSDEYRAGDGDLRSRQRSSSSLAWPIRVGIGLPKAGGGRGVRPSRLR